MIVKLKIVLLVVLSLSATGWAKYSGGTGEPNAPYLIATPNDLNSIGLDPCDWNKHFLVTADINIVGITGDSFNMIGNYPDEPFTGVFDGNDYVISNLTFESIERVEGIGLFGYISGETALVKNLTLVSPNLGGPTCDTIGSLVAFMESGMILNCRVESGSAAGDECIGGLVGWLMTEASIVNCFANVNVSGSSDTGGLVSVNEGHVLRSHSSGNVSGVHSSGGLVGGNCLGQITSSSASGSVEGESSTGGLVGSNLLGMISKCCSIGDVNGSWERTGGLVGSSGGSTISEGYSKGNVSGVFQVGGLMGSSTGDTIINCFSSSKVSSTGLYGAGGFSGSSIDSSYNKCFWDDNVNSDVNGVAEGVNDPNLTGKSTAELQKLSTFTNADWDMINVWDIGENQTYPFLRTHLPSDINKDDETNFLDLAILAQNWLKE